MWRRHHKTKFGGKFKSAYRNPKNQLQIGQNELKTIQSTKENLRNDAKKNVFSIWKMKTKLKVSNVKENENWGGD